MKENDATPLACEYPTSTSYFEFEHTSDAPVGEVKFPDILLHSFDSTTPPPPPFRPQDLIENTHITQADVLETPASGNYSARALEKPRPQDDTIVRPFSNPCSPALSPTVSQLVNAHPHLEQPVMMKKESYCLTLSSQHGSLQTNNSPGFEIDGTSNSRYVDHIVPLDHHHHQLFSIHHPHVGDSIDAEEISQDRNSSDILRNSGVMGHLTRTDHQNVMPIQTLQQQNDTIVHEVLQSPPNASGRRVSGTDAHTNRVGARLNLQRYLPENKRLLVSPSFGNVSIGPATTSSRIFRHLQSLQSSPTSTNGVRNLYGSGREVTLCSPGHQPYPDVDPGHILGIRRPLRTQRHVLFDVPFYGIENVEISSDRYTLMMRSHASHEHETQLSNHGTTGHSYSDSGSLMNHREHIWSIVHEDEYGLPVNTGQEGDSGIGVNNGNDVLVWGRYKRFHRWVPIRPTTNPNSVSRSQEGITRDDPMSDSATDATLSSRPEPRVSQGVYGPDSFMESLEASRVPPVPSVPLKGRRRLTVLISRHRKICLMVLALVVIMGVIVAVLLLKRSSSSAQQPQDVDIDIMEMESDQ
ncbi:hypothetical protein BG011_005251 [Mortierella polycephala]|uniref:Uncharacterized protein n=1 Tax=Mortierella polycephala TaxID=41804 RepID=A0A9P6QD55_9FUNG|nr:hypothetical protein BG011_005251 [Mortierella polycephala]